MPLTARHDLAHEMKVKECLNEQGCIVKKKKSSQGRNKSMFVKVQLSGVETSDS